MSSGRAGVHSFFAKQCVSISQCAAAGRARQRLAALFFMGPALVLLVIVSSPGQELEVGAWAAAGSALFCTRPASEAELLRRAQHGTSSTVSRSFWVEHGGSGQRVFSHIRCRSKSVAARRPLSSHGTTLGTARRQRAACFLHIWRRRLHI